MDAFNGPARLPRDYNLFAHPPAHVILCLWRLKRHLLHRPLQRLQRGEQLQCRHCRPAHVP